MKKLLAVTIVAAFLFTAPVLADSAVTFDLSNASLNFQKKTSSVSIGVTETEGSWFDVKLEDPNLSPNVRDTARIIVEDSPSFECRLNMNLTKTGSVWGGTGDLWFTDVNGVTKASADFKTSSIIMQGHDLFIFGNLTTQAGNDSILLPNGVDPWTYMGQKAIVGKMDQDTVPGQITVPGHNAFDNGSLILVKFDTNFTSLDEVFREDMVLDGGELKGKIIPAPAAVVLGFIGLSLVGWRMRRYA
jgi:hypothetical protein